MAIRKEPNFEIIDPPEDPVEGLSEETTLTPEETLDLAPRGFPITKTKLDFDLDEPLEETSSERLNEVNRHFKEQLFNAREGRDKERNFRMYMVTHTVLAADEAASDEALIRNFLLSKPGLMSILQDEENLRALYDAFENHISLHGAHHLLLSPEGFIACLRRIATKANKALAKHTGKPSYLNRN
ncbi:MAG: hypothetical protein WDA41_09315 [Candidatus Neomarinimicrobiota bacterium]|jgi:hypothetical protein